jgi:polyphosphate kinase
MGVTIRNKEISWLYFNERLLQEASKNEVPLIERLKFLGIYSNNLDEFFRVRVAILRRLAMVGKATLVDGDRPRTVLSKIEEIVVEQQQNFQAIFKCIIKELKNENIFLINEKELTPEQGEFVASYFKNEVRPHIMPIILKKNLPFPILRDNAIYMAVHMDVEEKSQYALIEVPTDNVPRFVIIPSDDDKTHIILLEDIIRYELRDIFYMFDFEEIESYIIKITRDAELDIDDDVAESYMRAVAKSLEKRGQSEPVRFIYDKNIPLNFLKTLLKRLNFDEEDTVIGSGRIHNFKDFMNFPKVGNSKLLYKPLPPSTHNRIIKGKTYIETIREGDLLFHYPYQSFSHFIDLLREASIDPKVTDIKLTVYRVAGNSSVLNALINAARNGKKVTVVLELRARFNEKSNINWSNVLSRENVKVIFGVPGLKVHSELCLISRTENKEDMHFACIGTGNFNEETSGVFSDHLLWTSHKGITEEVLQVFNFFEKNYRLGKFEHLLVSPFSTRSRVVRLINQEIKNATEGKKAAIYIKCNHLVDLGIIRKLHEAARKGVEVQVNVRGMFAMMPTPPDKKYTISAFGLIDRFLEHSRIFWFHNNGDDKMYISSADLMTRNLDRRVEVAVPIYDRTILEELKFFLEIQLKDNCAARLLNNELDNRMRTSDSEKKVRSQLEFYKFIKKRHG